MSKILDLLNVYRGKKDKAAAQAYYNQAPSFYKPVGCIDVLFDSQVGAKRVRCGFFVNPLTMQYFCGSKAYNFFEDVTATIDMKCGNKVSAPEPKYIPMKIDPNAYTMSNVLPTQPSKLIVFKPDDSFIARHK